MYDADAIDKVAKQNADLTYNNLGFFATQESKDSCIRLIKEYRDSIRTFAAGNPAMVRYAIAYSEFLINKIQNSANDDRDRQEDDRPRLG